MPSARSIGSVTGQLAALTADGRWLASATSDGTITVSAVSNLAPVMKFFLSHKAVSALEFDSKGVRLGMVDADGHATAWRWARRERGAIWNVSAACRALAFSPDGKILGLGLAGGTVQFREPETGKLERTLAGHNSEVLGVKFSKDGQWFVSGGSDFTARVWDVRKGKQIAVLKADRIGVFVVDFSPDMSRVVTAAMDGTIRFWNFATRHQVLTLKGHRMQPALAFVDTDRQLISLSGDGIRYWRAPSLTQIEEAEAKPGRR